MGGALLNIEKKNEILSDAYSNAQDMITLADSKANISLTIQTLLIGIGLGASLLSNSFEKVKSLSTVNPFLFNFYLFIAIIFVVTSITGILATIFVFKPRQAREKTERERQGLLYFGHVMKYKSSVDYLVAVGKIEEEDLLKEYAQQIYTLSYIAKKKMKFVNVSIYFLIFNILLTIFFLILSGFINLL